MGWISKISLITNLFHICLYARTIQSPDIVIYAKMNSRTLHVCHKSQFKSASFTCNTYFGNDWLLNTFYGWKLKIEKKTESQVDILHVKPCLTSRRILIPHQQTIMAEPSGQNQLSMAIMAQWKSCLISLYQFDFKF